MDQDLYSNEGHETFFPELVNNEFNVNGGLQQPAVVIQPDNVNASCSCADCSSTIDDNHLQMTYQDTNVTVDRSEQQSMASQQISLAQYSSSCPNINHNENEQVSSTAPQNSSMPQDIGTTQCSPLSSPMYVNEQTPQYSPCTCNDDNAQHQQQQSISTRDDLRSDELFRLTIRGGFEIVVRNSYLNHFEAPNERNGLSQQNKRSHLALKNHARKTHHPYRAPTVQSNRHNDRDHIVNSSSQQHHHSCSNSRSEQKNHYSNVNSGSSVDMQDTRVNQSDNTQTQPPFH
jgi:hypothetical protein